MTLSDRVETAVRFIQSKYSLQPTIGLILGSGLGEYAEEMEEANFIPYEDIPDFPVSTVEGHVGRFVLGYCMGKPTIMMQGRFHFYEGYKGEDIALPIRVMKGLGVEILLITNAAGGIRETFKPGDLMVIKDHINIAGVNPLIGKNSVAYGPRFPDMSRAYDREIQRIIHLSAIHEKIDLQEGVYAMMSGPSYETPAEIKMLRLLGADAVGMSTVPEVIAAVHCGLLVGGISCITNMAAGILDQPLKHQEVVETAELTRDTLKRCLNRVIFNLK